MLWQILIIFLFLLSWCHCFYVLYIRFFRILTIFSQMLIDKTQLQQFSVTRDLRQNFLLCKLVSRRDCYYEDTRFSWRPWYIFGPRTQYFRTTIFYLLPFSNIRNTTKSWLIFILHIIENLLTRKIFQFTEIFQNFSAILSIKFIIHK